MKFLLILLFCFFIDFQAQAQLPCRIFCEADLTEKKQEYLKIYGVNKILHSDYEMQILVALSYFPELVHTKIRFVESRIQTTMQCRPELFSLLNSKANRQYVIIINSYSSFNGALLKNVPFNAQIGIIGHELCHILDYEKRGFGGIMKRGFDYFSHNAKRTFECEIDSLTIEKGLGWQLYDWAHYSINNTLSSEAYKNFKLSTYLPPDAIISFIRNRSSYVPTMSLKE